MTIRSLSVGIYLVPGILTGALLAMSNVSAADAGQKTNARIEWFYGVVDKASLQAFMTKVAGKKIERLGINSQGGYVDAALDLANWTWLTGLG